MIFFIRIFSYRLVYCFDVLLRSIFLGQLHFIVITGIYSFFCYTIDWFAILIDLFAPIFKLLNLHVTFVTVIVHDHCLSLHFGCISTSLFTSLHFHITVTYHCVVCWTIDEGETGLDRSPTLTPEIRSLSKIQEVSPSLPPPNSAAPAIPYLVRRIGYFPSGFPSDRFGQLGGSAVVWALSFTKIISSPAPVLVAEVRAGVAVF